MCPLGGGGGRLDEETQALRAAGLTLCGYTELLQMGVRAGRKGTGLGVQKNRQKGLQEQVAFEAGEEHTGTTDKGAKCPSGTKAGSGEGAHGVAGGGCGAGLPAGQWGRSLPQVQSTAAVPGP